MIELHERLSEFSYGYGVTKDVERLLEGIGVRAVPFMPSLLQEKAVGFDVAFRRPGVPLLLQFKLGQSLTRFIRSDLSEPAPALQRPFFRFALNTAEPDGQYETLLKAQTDGAEVYYIAPRFADWPHYIRLFESEAVLENSAMLTPIEIRDALVSKKQPDGPHRVVYDRVSVHVCSKPMEVKDVRPDQIADNIAKRVGADSEALGDIVDRVYHGLDDKSTIRRVPLETAEAPYEVGLYRAVPSLEDVFPPALTRVQRSDWLGQLRPRARSEEDAIAVAMGIEMWGLGIQLLLVGAPE